jgi:hypothetical protein
MAQASDSPRHDGAALPGFLTDDEIARRLGGLEAIVGELAGALREVHRQIGQLAVALERDLPEGAK